MKNQSSTRSQILIQLRLNEELGTRDLAESLDLTAPTIRQHLSVLEAEGLIEARNEKIGRGRPRKMFQLTEEAETEFPKAYDVMARVFLRAMHRITDPDTIIENYTEAAYDMITEEFDDLETILQTLGMMPEWSMNNGNREVKYHQCPFYEVAIEDDIVCDVEANILSRFTGGEVETEGTIARGDSKCKFVLHSNSSTSDDQ